MLKPASNDARTSVSVKVRSSHVPGGSAGGSLPLEAATHLPMLHQVHACHVLAVAATAPVVACIRCIKRFVSFRHVAGVPQRYAASIQLAANLAIATYHDLSPYLLVLAT